MPVRLSWIEREKYFIYTDHRIHNEVEIHMLYLITGGAGFIGSNIAAALLQRGDSVRVLDNFSTGKRQNLLLCAADSPKSGSLEVLEGDIRNIETCRQACRGADYVVHHAALISVFQSVQDPLLANETNITGTLNMLASARESGIKRFVLASSSAVYGDSGDSAAPKTETMKPAPMSPYAVNKLTGEEYCRIFYELYGLETVALRYFNVFGPKQDPASEYAAVIPKFIDALMAGKPPLIYGDGKQSRDFIYVEDVVRANLLACSAQKAAGKTFNIACGRQVSINELLDEIKVILHTTLAAVYKEARPGDILHSVADTSLAGRLLGFEPIHSFRDALSKTITWYGNEK